MSPQNTAKIDTYRVQEDPVFVSVNDCQELQELVQCYKSKIPVALVGPTGCGKTTLVDSLAYKLAQEAGDDKYVGTISTVMGQQDLTASTLIGEFIMKGDKPVWIDGPATMRVRHGGILYIDEIAEARPDTMTVIHSITDYRRHLTIPEREEVILAPDTFMAITSWNPGYQRTKMKPSTRQRFWHIELDYLPVDQEANVIAKWSGIEEDAATSIARVGEHIRSRDGTRMGSDLSTSQLIYAASLIKGGSDPAMTLKRIAVAVNDVSSHDERAELEGAIDTILSDLKIS